MGHTEKFNRSGTGRRVLHNNADFFLRRERLDDEEMAQWIIAAYGNTPEFKAMEPQEAIAAFSAVVDKNSREIFGQHMSGRSLGGMALMMAQMMQNVETAQGFRFDAQAMPVELKNGLLLSVALEHLAQGKSLSRVGVNALNNGGRIMEALSDYAREVALVLPFSGKDSAALRDKIRMTSQGMPAVDIKFSSIAQEYETYVAGRGVSARSA